MIKANFNTAECQANNETFFRFKTLIISTLYDKLNDLKKRNSIDVTEEESNNLKWLKNQEEYASANSEPRMTSALGTFNANQEECITKLMQKGCQASNSAEQSDAYTLFLSHFLNTETRKLIRLKSRSQSCAREKSRDHRITDIVPYDDLQIAHSSFKKLKSTQKHLIYRASTPDGHRVLKILKSKSAPTEDVENLMKELNVADELEHHVFMKSYARTKLRNRHAIVLEWIDEYCLGDSDVEAFNVPDFLAIAKDLMSSFIELQKKESINIHLNSNNIMITKSEGTTDPSTKIILSGSSISNTKDKSYISKDGLHAVDLRHISPEQSGRTNRKIDFRSEFYSLGIVFYKILSGTFPFENENVSKLINLHITQDPPPIPNIPKAINDMISKLLKKSPDDRYQSANGICTICI